jgi:hypothetical protein
MGSTSTCRGTTSTEETQCNRNLVGSKSFVHSRL